MIKSRLGEDFATKIASNIEIKAIETKKNGKDGKRKPRGDFKDRKPR